MDEDDQRKRLLRQRRPGQRVGGHEEPVIGKELAWRLLLDAGHPTKEGFAAAGAAGWLRWRLRFGRGRGGQGGLLRAGRLGDDSDEQRNQDQSDNGHGGATHGRFLVRKSRPEGVGAG
jgi:hypothetical protein